MSWVQLEAQREKHKGFRAEGEPVRFLPGTDQSLTGHRSGQLRRSYQESPVRYLPGTDQGEWPGSLVGHKPAFVVPFLHPNHLNFECHHDRVCHEESTVC